MIDLPKISADLARARSQSNSAKDYFEIVKAGSACIQHAADLLAELDRTLIALGIFSVWPHATDSDAVARRRADKANIQPDYLAIGRAEMERIEKEKT
jgi:hypothetical protein